MSDKRPTSRRRFLQLTGASAVAGLAGCGGGGSSGGGGGSSGGGSSGGGGGSSGGGGLGPVPSEYETATSLDGTERNPDALVKKSGVQYQSSPKDGQQCSGCRYYIEDKNGDGLGACTIVEGKIEPEGYCVSYAPYSG